MLSWIKYNILRGIRIIYNLKKKTKIDTFYTHVHTVLQVFLLSEIWWIVILYVNKKNGGVEFFYHAIHAKCLNAIFKYKTFSLFSLYGNVSIYLTYIRRDLSLFNFTSNKTYFQRDLQLPNLSVKRKSEFLLLGESQIWVTQI